MAASAAPHFKGKSKGRRLRLERNLERPAYNLTIFRLHFGPLTLKLYTKGEAVLRAEVMLHNARAWSVLAAWINSLN
ncbi:MAG: hypothetical protein HS114_16250 [Anaerolineales bacterium]|nr:hypothetical protein [Anaerolineales bacterium]